ncbi:MAG TPA: methyltransferase domain-containing protein [Ruania sp.]|nr:methyltransferase domain-containing protein [Ruania sp.]
MSVSLIRSATLASADYAHAASVPASSRLLFLAGACPLDASGATVGVGDYEAQARAVVANLTQALADGGASLREVVSTRVLVASSHRGDLVQVWNMVRAAFGDHDVPSTLVGVSVLGYPDQLVEVEAVAAVPEVDSFADGEFSDPRLAQLYDVFDPDRSDLDGYAAIAAQVGAHRVLDVGCGTGTFACLLAERGLEVTGVDPAAASLEVARSKPGADAVTWLHGDATTLPPMQVDLATMTANVAQVFTTDSAWEATLTGIYRALRPGGHLVFETRIPAVRAWERWTKEHTFDAVQVPGTGRVEAWNELVDVRGELVTFRGVTRFVDDGVSIPSVTTLRFRSREQIEESLGRCGFDVVEVRGAPDRPGREWVFIAQRRDEGRSDALW